MPVHCIGGSRNSRRHAISNFQSQSGALLRTSIEIVCVSKTCLTSEPAQPPAARMIDLSRISGHRLETEPYRWACIDRLFAQSDAAALAATFPRDHFKRQADHAGDKVFEYRVRSLIRPGTDSISQPDALSDAWRALAHDLLLPGYRAALSSLTGLDLRGALLDVNVFHYPPGSSHGPHPDHRDKIVTHVLYFNDSWNDADGGCLTILGSANAGDIVRSVSPVAGNSAVLVRSDDSWHAVSPVAQNCHLTRRSLTATFYRPGSSLTLWPPEDTTPTYDYDASVWRHRWGQVVQKLKKLGRKVKGAQINGDRSGPSSDVQIHHVATPESTRIALVTVSSDSNRGACALTWASIEFVLEAFPGASIAIIPIAETPASPDAFRHTRRRYPNVEILPPLFDGGGTSVFRLLGLLTQSLRKILTFKRERPNSDPALEWLRHCDLVVSVGGITFETLHGTFRDDARLLIRSLPLLAAEKIDLRFVLVGAQAGPFNTAIGRRLFRHISSSAAAIVSRDLVSAAEVQRAPQARQTILPDSAFSLELSQEVPSGLLAERGIGAASPILALVISSALSGDERREEHVSLFVRVAQTLRASGLVEHILVVVQCDEDKAISLELVQALELDARFLIDEDLGPRELSSLYGSCRMVIASRLHAVILSLLAGVPAVSLAPEMTFKERAVLDMLGLASLCVPTRLGPDRAAELCLEVATGIDRYRQAIARAVSAARAALKGVPHTLREAAKKGEVRAESRQDGPVCGAAMDATPAVECTPTRTVLAGSLHRRAPATPSSR
jgi:polysaccharide pyruvyl transferase WcaK-like protein